MKRCPSKRKSVILWIILHPCCFQWYLYNFPAAGALLAAVAVFFYRIDEKLMENIKAELKKRREA
ncbi:hypothetical protein JW935_23695 [candidate division KSB1 bacterium]|nr:hypothetical protein [candidate division KSB1 bacterium]